MSKKTLIEEMEVSDENYEIQKSFIFHKAENIRKVSILSNQVWNSEMDLILKVRAWMMSEGLNPPSCLNIRIMPDKAWCQLWFERDDYHNGGYKWFASLRERTDLILVSSNGHPAWYLSFLLKKEIKREALEKDDEMDAIFSGKKKPVENRVVRNVSRRQEVRQKDVEVDLDRIDDESPW